MASNDELLAQIWAAPEDRARLAVYADWLIEHGDATRGEFMQLSLREDRTAAQERRRRSLRRRFRGKWLGAARPYLYTWEESEASPGFIERVQCSTKKLEAGFELVRALGPRLVISINPVATTAERARLASLPLGKLYGLAFCDADLQWITDRLVTLLAPRMVGLRRLEIFVWSNLVTLEGWRALLAVHTLEELELTCGDASDPLVEALLESPLARRLRRITVSAPESAELRSRLAAAFADRVLELGE